MKSESIFNDILKQVKKDIRRRGLRETARIVGIDHAVLLRTTRGDTGGSRATWAALMNYYMRAE